MAHPPVDSSGIVHLRSDTLEPKLVSVEAVTLRKVTFLLTEDHLRQLSNALHRAMSLQAAAIKTMVKESDRCLNLKDDLNMLRELESCLTQE